MADESRVDAQGAAAASPPPAPPGPEETTSRAVGGASSAIVAFVAHRGWLTCALGGLVVGAAGGLFQGARPAVLYGLSGFVMGALAGSLELVREKALAFADGPLVIWAAAAGAVVGAIRGFSDEGIVLALRYTLAGSMAGLLAGLAIMTVLTIFFRFFFTSLVGTAVLAALAWLFGR